jgi:ribose/xylose/arabinose/galactoside ABC-type transport system permease subunit
VKKILLSATARSFLLLIIVIAIFATLDYEKQRFLNVATAFSALQLFATIGPLALGLGLTMIAREFDLSIGGMMSLAGCVAVLTGATFPAVGVFLAVAVGAVAGAAQASIATRMHLSSIAVTLAGLLTMSGIAYVLTDNTTIGYPRMDVASAINAPILSVFSIRSLIAIGIFALVAAMFSLTRLGRDIVATGSDRVAATAAGVPVGQMLLLVFTASGVLAATSGSLLSYGLAAASPIALADVLVPAAVAAIVGGVSLSGGKGSPIGIMGGALVFCVLRSGLISMGVKPFVQDIAIGVLLVAVALIDARNLRVILFRISRQISLSRGSE